MSTDFQLFDSEQEAADIAAAMIYDGTAFILGVQFPDKRVIEADNWEALDEAQARYEEKQGNLMDLLAQQRLERKFRRVISPFDSRETLEVSESIPSWIGF